MINPLRSIKRILFALVAMHATVGHPGLDRKVGDTTIFTSIAKDSVSLANCLLDELKKRRYK